MSSTLSSILRSRQNVFIHGPGGTGKSKILLDVADYFNRHGISYALTAPTGIAASNLSDPDREIVASTLHSYCGIGLGKGDVWTIIKRIRRKPNIISKYRNIRYLIVDEISMVGAELFEKLDQIFRAIRGFQCELFGGVRLIFSGDFLQLSPINDQYIFESDRFDIKEWHVIPMTIPYRYTNTDVFQLLMRCRYGEISQEDIGTLSARRVAYDNLDTTTLSVRPTRLVTHRRDADRINTDEMAKLTGGAYKFTCRDSETLHEDGEYEDGYDPDTDVISDDKFLEQAKQHLEYQIPEVIILKVGAQVMLRVNLDVSRGLVNGTRGVITEITPKPLCIKMLLVSGDTINIEPYKLKINSKRRQVTRKQLPIVPAFAITIHKSQGLTLDCAVIDLNSRVFCGGQGYVALSRVRDLSGLYLSAFDPKSLYSNPRALQYVKLLEQTH